MDDLNKGKYIQTTKSGFDPLSVLLALIGLSFSLYSLISIESSRQIFDPRGFFSVVIGTLAILLFQNDLKTMFHLGRYLLMASLKTPDHSSRLELDKIDQAILEGQNLIELREGVKLTGDTLNDVVYMLKNGLIYEEIETFLSSKFASEYKNRERATEVMRKGMTVAPGLGLLGTVIGLIGVLRGLDDPSNIGPSMSLALMTTAYGAALNSLFFSPIAGRLEFHNQIYLQSKRELLQKIKILLLREEKRLDQELILENQAGHEIR